MSSQGTRVCGGRQDASSHSVLLCSPRLDGCRLTEDCCGRLSSTVGTSRLRDLDLSNNGLGDAGMRALWRGLRDARLDTLRWAPLETLPYQVDSSMSSGSSSD